MMQHLQTINALFQAIEVDQHAHSPSAHRYPVRFIFLNSFQALRTLIDHFNRLSIPIVQLKTKLLYEDAWLTVDDILHYITSLKGDAVIVPLSEVLRFFPDADFIALVTSLFELEQTDLRQVKRVYLPLVGLKWRFENLAWNTFHRQEQWAPLWSLAEPAQEKIRIYQLVEYQSLQLKQTPPGFFTIHNTSDWLELWKQQDLRVVLCQSESMAYLYQHFLPDALFQPEKIITPKDYLEKILRLHLPILYNSVERLLWETLIAQENEHLHDKAFLDFEHVINAHFNIQNFRTVPRERLLALWFQHSETFSRWLLKHWISTQASLQNSYLGKSMANLMVYSDDELLTNVWFTIFQETHPDVQLCEERKTYLTLIHRAYKFPVHQLEEQIRQKLPVLSQKPFDLQAQYLTNSSYAERTYLLELLRTQPLSEVAASLEMMRTVYPELYFYLQWPPIQSIERSAEWLTTYFREYTLSKVRHQKTERLTTLLNEKNHDAASFYDWYYQIKSYPLPENTPVVWIDGLGAEWLPLLEYLINKHGKAKNKHVQEKYLTKVNLPSITKCNRFDKALHVVEFDEFIHHRESPYTFPDTLIQQVELLESLVKKHLIERSEERIAVVSDHGFTFLAQKEFGNYKKYDFREAEHEGRYMWTDRDYQPDSEFLCHPVGDKSKPEKNVLVALKHTSLYNTPSREVHGGATPEEVIVPYLIISKIDDRIVYHVTLLTPEISVREPLLKVSITPHPAQIPMLLWKGKEIRLVKQTEAWGAMLQGFKAGEYQFELQVVEQKFDIFLTIKGGFKEKDLL